MAKPTGSKCNLNCAYCFFLKKESLYPGSSFRMSDAVMEEYVRQTIEAHRTHRVTIAWQGGEPTLMGLDFFRRSIDVEKRYLRPAMTVENTIQTNGVLLDEKWCSFLHDNNFLVGLSLDGPKELHDVYRRDKKGRSVFDRVIRGARLMQTHGVQFNVLCTVNAVNGHHPLELYRFFRDELKVKYLQFIPIVERDNVNGFNKGNSVTSRSVTPGQYGRFLVEIFDEWVQKDVGSMFIQLFDGVLASWVRGYSTLCIFRPRCGEGVALEHNGDVYCCDHFVEPAYLLGNIQDHPLAQLVGGARQREFGETKSIGLPAYCRTCDYLFACNGECPKNRFFQTPDGEEGLNYLCAGLKHFFRHTEKSMRIMASLIRQGKTLSQVMNAPHRPGRNEPCFCGSGIKYKRCHGR